MDEKEAGRNCPAFFIGDQRSAIRHKKEYVRADLFLSACLFPICLNFFNQRCDR
jgi:hypothetical protein